VDGKHFKNGGFQKQLRLDNHVINPQECTQVFLSPVMAAFSNFSGVVLAGPKAPRRNAGEIWKRRFHFENASNVFRPR